MFDLLSKFFGTKSGRDIKAVMPYVNDINKHFEELNNLSDDALRNESDKLRETINQKLKSIDDDIASHRQKLENNPEMDINEKEHIFNQIDKLKENRDEQLENVLMEILPRGFAVVKETARRFKENEKLEVTANYFDKKVAARREGVEIEGEKAIWYNKWKAAGVDVTWDMVHFDVQLIGGVVLHEGKIAEMSTGEGKTLVATLPAYLNGLTGEGVHIITVNDYLAKRDSEWMGPLFEFHGLTVDCIDKYEPHSEERKAAYQADIIYGTNNEFGFDYLRDNMVSSTEDIVQRKFHFAMIDEVDSVLVDDARTPLIISGPVSRGDEQKYYELKSRVSRLVEAQRKTVGDLLNEAKKEIAQGNDDENSGGLALLRAHRGLPKYKPLIKYLSETGHRQILQSTENFYLQDNAKQMPKVDEVLYFTIDEKSNTVELTEKGNEFITQEGEEENFFILPDLGEEMAKIDNEDLDEETRAHKKNELIEGYKEKTERIHVVNMLLKAYTLFERETEYIVDQGKVKIVDENTGRIMEGRRYSDGLHQALEAKENVKVEEASQTYASITLQNFFRMYHKLAGMTGTAETEAGELWEIYKLDVVSIPTNVPCIRDDKHDKIFRTVREKYNAVADEIVELNRQGRPVLVGTTSVDISEKLSRMLKMKEIKHNVLNAKNHKGEADIVAEAGESGAVTIATNMAGRGTDIKLTQASKEAGGLAIIGTERHESRRIDRQLRGRAGRQGDPGSSQFFVSLEDNLMRLFGSERISKLMDRMGIQEGEVIQHSMISRSIERAQKKVEENNFGIRKRLLDYDDVLNMQRNAIYQKRKNALYGDRLQVDIADMVYDTCEHLLTNAADYDNFIYNFIYNFGFTPTVTDEDFGKEKNEQLTEKLYDEVSRFYKEKNRELADKSSSVFNQIYITKGKQVENVSVPITDGRKVLNIPVNLEKAYQTKGMALPEAIQKFTVLQVIDQEWKEHLREMDDLRQSVQNAVYEQKDPLLIYKREAYTLFTNLVNKLNEETLSFLFKADIYQEDETEISEARSQRKNQPKTRESKEEMGSLLHNAQTNGGQEAQKEKSQPVRSQKTYGRNDMVKVQYSDGSVKKEKFKKIEKDIKDQKCVVVEE